MDIPDLDFSLDTLAENGSCELKESCPFYGDTLPPRPDREELLEKYCGSNNLRCARYMVFQALGISEIPDGLYPDEKAKAYESISAE